MRGYRWATALLALLSAGLLAGSTLAILDTGDQVTVEREVLVGDPAAAQGLEVTLPLTCGNQLFWTTTFPANRPEEAKTDFSYTLSQDYRIQPWDDQPLSVELDQNQLYQQAQDAALAHPGNSFSFRVGDYFDSWPLRVTTDWREGNDYDPSAVDRLSRLFQSYFSIPVSPDSSFTVTVQDWRGNGASYSTSYKDETGIPHLSNFSAPCGNSILFVMNNIASAYGEDEAGNYRNIAVALDGSRIPGGWGLYRYTPGGEDAGGTLATLWSLPEGAEILEFWGAEETDFFLLTREEGQLRLRVFDGDGNLRQSLDLLPFSGEESYMQTYKGDGFFVPMIYGSRDEGYCYHFAVVSKEGDGWTLALTGDDRQADALGCGGFSWASDSYSGLAMAFNEERLAVRDSSYSDSSSFWLAVYSRDGLDCLTIYRNSVSQAAHNLAGPTYYDTARLFWTGGPLVRWEETAS